MTFDRERGSLILVLVLLTVLGSGTATGADNGSLDEWAVQPGLSLAIDSAGFSLPTAIAFVPNPGNAPNDPLYFVTQLRGEIKVVTNDRSIHTFATVQTSRSQKEDLRGASQQGLAGICLEPHHGYVFVTLTQPDATGILRNNIVRFTTRPRTFALAPHATRDLREIFADVQSAPAHQIGGCQVRGDSLFVGVGDGGNVSAVRNLDLLLGKILCLSLDGDPCRDHPFRKARPAAAGRAAGAPYVWAYGLRNPFGLAIVGDAIFVAENGMDVDRFLKVRRGADHHWDGSDQSIAVEAIVVFLPPAVSPVQLAVLKAAPTSLPARFANHFFVAIYGGDRGVPGVVAFGYDFETSRALGPPKYVVTHRGRMPQRVLGVAVGPDGVYIVPAMPDARGHSSILKLYHEPGKEHSVLIGRAGDGLTDPRTELLERHSCTNCHPAYGRGGAIGPSLDRHGITWRLTERLNSREYEQMLARTDLRTDEPFVAYRQARQEVLQARGRERTRIWLKYFLLEPRFDNPGTLMPNPRLTESQAEALRDSLYGAPAPTNPVGRALQIVGRARRATALGFAAGAASSALVVSMLVGVYVWRGRRRAR